ncbi:FAT domain containing protein [Aphelenchoides avenae]|nr:FAT domain containing protein [Aphelenchus avenae]
MPTTGGAASAGVEQLSKRGIMLMRLAMRQNIFGQVATIKPHWMERQLSVPTDTANTEQALVQHQLNQAQATIEVLSSVLLYLPEKTVLEVFTPLQRALINCMNSSHQNLQRAAYTVIAKLFEKTASSARGLEQFELLTQHIQKNIHDAFSGSVGGSQPIIMGITLLKAICNVQPAYLDTSCLQPFLKMLHRMVREYVVPVNTYGAATAVHIEPKEKMLAEVICYCLEMLRPRINAMNGDVRRTIVQALIVPLIDKNAVDKIITVIIGVAQELLSTPLQQVQPTHQPAKFGMELLLRMQQQMDARLHTNAEMMRAFLGAVVIVFEDTQLTKLQGTAEVRARLQPAFYWGLCSSDEALRTRYFAVLESSFPQDIYQRLMCIMSKQNWQPMSQYFWIAHAARLLLCAALGKRGHQKTKTEEDGTAPPTSRLRVTKCATFANTLEKILEKLTSDLRSAYEQNTTTKISDTEKGNEAMDVDATSLDTLGSAPARAGGIASGRLRSDSNTNLSQESIDQMNATITAVEDRYLKLATGTTEEQYAKLVDSLTELMHYDWQLAYGVWKKLFTTIWSQLSTAERDELSAISQPFISSGIMLPQRDAAMSVVTCFVDSLLSCDPPVHFQPSLLRYIGTSQKCWHISVLALERQAKSIRLTNDPSLLDRDNPPNEKLAVLECLADLYTELNESDQYEMCWKRRVYFEKTAKCLTLYNQGEYKLCRKALEELMSTTYERLSQPSPLDQLAHFAPPIHAEMRHWEQQWVNSLKELNDWSALLDFANAEEVADPSLLMDAAWHSDNWPLVAQSVVQVDACANPTTHFKSTMIKIMSNLANGYLYETKEGVDKSFQDTSRHLISEWRKLPRIVSHSHLRLLIATHVVHEVSEANSVAAEIHRGQTPQGLVMSQKLITEVKLVSKTWRNRAMTVIDPMSTWFDLENWRIQHYQTTMRAMDTSAQINPHTQQMFPMHSIAQTQFQLARNMRRCGQYEMAIEELNKLHKMMSVHSMDASMKVYEHVKCLLKIADELKESPPSEGALTPQVIFNEATDIIDSTDMQFLTKDHCSRLLTIKAHLLSQMNNTEEANKAFSAAARLQENNVAGSTQGAQVWKYWSEHLERLFLQNRSEASALEYGTNAISCLMECAKTTNEEKSRAYLAKLFWLLKTVTAYGGQRATGAVDEVLLKYHVNVPASSWVFWLNEIVADVRQRDGLGMVTVLRSVAEAHPQQALVALRLALDPKVVTERIQKGPNGDEAMDTTAVSEWLRKPEKNPAEETAYTADSADWKAKLCSVVDLVSIVQPTDVACLNTMLNELDELPQSWVETKMCQLRCIIDDCHKHLYARINELSRAKVPDVIRKATHNWLEQAPSTLLTESDEVLWREITSELNNAVDEPLLKFAFVLRKFMRKLRAKMGARIRLLKLRTASSFLANFDSKLAEIDVFSGTVCPKIAQYSAYISRFLPVYRLIVRHNTVCRVLLIRSMNGKVYSYILDRVRFDLAKSQASQIFTLLNTHLAKYRETARRFLCFPQPHVLHTGRNSRLMECCPIAGASSQMQNLNADRSYANFRPFIEIMRQELDREAPGRDPYDVIDSFYERISVAESANEGQSNLKTTLSEAFREIIAGNGHVGDTTHSPPTTFRPEPFAEGPAVAEPEPMAVDEGAARVALPAVTPVPTSLLSRWFHDRYPDPTTFWHIRKKMAAHFALLGISEYVFSMTAMDLDGLTVDLSTGQLFYTDFSFDIIRKFSEVNVEDDKPELELECIRPVPFRLSSNIAAFLGVSIEGHLCSAAIAAARCFHSRPVDTIIRPLLWDAFWKANNEHHANGDQQFVDAVFRGLERVSKRVKGLCHT